MTIEVEAFFEPEVDGPVCTSSGIKCHDCWTSLNCIDLGNGTFHPELQHCPMGESCKEKTGTCKSDGNYECFEQDKLQCNNMKGIFPSPFNCMEYFTCVTGPNNTLLKYVSKCESTYEFDPAKKLCRRRIIDDNRCTSSIPVCRNDSQSGPVQNNTNIFYRCQKESVALGFNFVPQLYGCPFNFQFNGTHCVDPMPNILDKNGLCVRTGYFSHPAECNHYYECNYIGESPTVRSCNNEYQKFDQSRGRCVYFSCDMCQA